MKKTMYLISLCLLICNLKLKANNTPIRLYKDIGSSISSAKGNVDLYFNEGWWVKAINGKKVIVYFSNNQRANFNFSYSAGQLQDGSRVVFTPSIHIWVKSNTGGISFSVDTIWYDDNGKFKTWGGVKFDHPGTNDLNQIGLAQTGLGLDFKSENLFNGKILKTLSSAKKCDNNGNIIIGNTSPCLTEILIKKPSDAEPGLAVSFIPNSTIHISSKISPGTYDNVVSISTGSFEFRYLDYDIVNQTVECEISQFDLNLQNGILQTEDMLINIGSGSKLKFDRLKIYHDANSSEVDAENGKFNVQVSSGTKISLSKTSKYKSELVFENGEMNLFDFGYKCSDDSKTVFQIGGASTLKVSTRSGSLALCNNNGYFSIANGRLESNLSGTWDSSSPNPDSHLNVSLLQVSLDNGYLPITSDNILGIKSGFIKSESLRFDGLSFSSFTGEIKDLNVILNDQSKFVIPGGMQFFIKEGGVIDGAEPNRPLKLDSKNKYVSGLFKLNVNFSVFSNSPNQTLRLNNGKIKMNLEVLDLDTIRGSRIYIDGNSTLSADNTSFNGHFEFSDENQPSGTLTFIRGTEPKFNSKFDFTLSPSNEIKITTPFIKGDQHEMRFFSTNFYVSLSDPIKSPSQDISLQGQNITIPEMILTPHFNLRIPTGKGEHEDADNDNSADGNHGPNWAKDCQEVFSIKPVCKRHIYLYPKNHGVSSTMKFSVNGQTISFNFGSVHFDQPFVEDEDGDKSKDWKHDGCGLPIIGGLAGLVTGVLLSPVPVVGEIAPVVLPIAGIVGGIRLEHIAEDYVDTKLAESITIINLNKQWKIQ